MRRLWVALIVPIAMAGGCDRPEAPAISLALHASVGREEGLGALAGYPVVGPRNAAGQFAVSTPWVEPPGLPVVFDASGVPVETLGSTGEGPGQFRRVERFISLAADSMLLIDSDLRRGTVVGPNWHPARSFSLPGMIVSAVELADGSLVASVGSFGVEPPLVHLSREGTLFRRFGDVPEDGRPRGQTRQLALAPDGTLWSAATERQLDLSRWDTSGARLQHLTPVRDWFPALEETRPVSPDNPPAARVQAIWTDSAGFLWVQGAAADPNWAEGLRRRPGAAEAPYEIEDPNRVFDGVLDAYDPANGTLVATFRDDRLFLSSPEPGLVVTTRTNEDGWYFAEVWRVELAP